MGRLNVGIGGWVRPLDDTIPDGISGGDTSPDGVPSGADGTVADPTSRAGIEP